MKGKLIILRGVPGCGKSTLGQFFESSIEGHIHIENDQYFYDEKGNYNFNKKEILNAVDYCLQKTKQSLEKGVKSISVGNTFTREEFIEVYKKLAHEFNYDFVSLIVENRHGNINTKGLDSSGYVVKSMEEGILNSIKLT